MDQSADAVVETVRAKRASIDNQIELIRTRLERADPRRVPTDGWKRALPLLAGGAGLWLWRRRRTGRVETLRDLLIAGVGELYAAEQLGVGALREMAHRAASADLRRAFEQHLLETEGQVERLERVFAGLGTRRRARRCKGMEGLVAEARDVMRNRIDDTRDAALIGVAQRTEHYEIAAYGTLRTYAETLGYISVARLLQQSLEEEQNADARLTGLAERFVNPDAIA